MTLEEIKKQMFSIQYGGICFVESDNAFTRKARMLQIIKRQWSGAEAGFVMKDGKMVKYGNLALDGKEVNRNFLSDEIFQYAKKRVEGSKFTPYETIAEDRLFCNFLSSQPMAFNLFWPLIQLVKHEAAQAVLAEMLKTLLSGDSVEQMERVTEVGIEYIPEYWEKCLHDKTALDAYFKYQRYDGKQGIIAVETKYTDRLGTNEARDVNPAIMVANELKDVFTAQGLADINSRKIKITQVFRNFLLTEKVRLMEESLDDSLSIIIAPEENISNKADEKKLHDALAEEYKYKFQTVSLENFVLSLKEFFPNEPLFEEFYKRYLEWGLVDKMLDGNKYR